MKAMSWKAWPAAEVGQLRLTRPPVEPGCATYQGNAEFDGTGVWTVSPHLGFVVIEEALRTGADSNGAAAS